MGIARNYLLFSVAVLGESDAKGRVVLLLEVKTNNRLASWEPEQSVHLKYFKVTSSSTTARNLLCSTLFLLNYVQAL